MVKAKCESCGYVWMSRAVKQGPKKCPRFGGQHLRPAGSWEFTGKEWMMLVQFVLWASMAVIGLIYLKCSR